MKKLFTAFLFLLGAQFVSAQMVKNPVEWSATAKKVADKTYEIHITANMPAGWHIYSQNTPKGGPEPTKVTFVKNPLVTLSGDVKEKGKLESHFEPLFGVDVKQYSNTVNFVQTVKLKANVNTSVDASVYYMVCDDQQCLPPSTKKFSVALK